ncbi:MAG: GYF domain-containing protein [Pirellulaceae bacterium]
MGIKFLCPNGHKMNVKAFLAGKRGKCPKCGVSVRIPQETPASDSGEDLLGDASVPAAVTAQQAVVQTTVRPVTAVAPSAPMHPATQTYAAPVVRPVMPVGAPAIPSVPAMAPGYQLAGPAVMRMPHPTPAQMPIGVDPISQAPNAIWYVRPPSGGQYGPARGDIMRKWVGEGRVSGDSLVWREGFPEWKSASQLFPSLAGIGAPAPAAGPPPPPAEVAPIPTVTRTARKLNAYEARKNQGNGMAVAILVVLGIICVALIIGLVFVLSQGLGGSQEVPKKSAAMTGVAR